MTYKLYKLMFLLILFSTLQERNYAHEEPELHQMCIEAIDYDSCFLKNSIEYKYTIQDDWKKYGSLIVNLSIWRRKGDNYIIPAINSQNKPIFIALNCKKNLLNSTGISTRWKGWFQPVDRFEINLFDEFCTNR